MAGQISSALIRPGRQLLDKELRMNVIAEGVKGLLRIRSESFVVCAFRIWEASERRASGFGGSWMAEGGGVGDWRAAWKLCMRALVDDSVFRSVVKLSASLNGAILSMGYCTLFCNVESSWELSIHYPFRLVVCGHINLGIKLR